VVAREISEGIAAVAVAKLGEEEASSCACTMALVLVVLTSSIGRGKPVRGGHDMRA